MSFRASGDANADAKQRLAPIVNDAVARYIQVMSLYGWRGLALVVPAVIVLLVIAVRAALALSLREAAGQRDSLTGSIAALMLIELGNECLGLDEVPVINLVIDCAEFVAGCLLIFALVAGVTFLFRPRLRRLGAQLIVVVILTFWWLALADLWN